MKPAVRRTVTIESLDYEGKGVAHVDGKVVFVDGALTGETAEIRTLRTKPSHETAMTERIVRGSSQRVPPRCRHFGTCGGCSMQHLEPRSQVAVKQRVLEDCLARIGNVVPEVLFPAIHGPEWGYRYRARLSVRRVVKKGGVLVGFHEKRSSYVVEMAECHVLPEKISRMLLPLRALIGGLSIPDRVPQIELAVGEGPEMLVFRILAPLSSADVMRLEAFAREWGLRIALQPKGPETVHALAPAEGTSLEYRLPEYGVRLPFAPTEFTQVNHEINRVLVRRAMTLLAPQPGERMADMFCGLGNFSLPMAALGARVTGIEGSEALVRRAAANAATNRLGDRAEFRARDLFTVTPDELLALGPFDGMLIDPPRDGAIALVKALEAAPPRRIVYVSCSPSTLARDAGVLVNVLGYALKGAGVVNMFPHTAHVESIALFMRP
ncbi:MAG: 23S rRNA (uracil(1939)-C(5))-methyltransferase RlmD [Burkholderiales bacterium]